MHILSVLLGLQVVASTLIEQGFCLFIRFFFIISGSFLV